MATGGIAVADSGPAAKDAAFSEPFGKAPEPLYELPLGPHTEHMAKGVAAALRSLMRSCADPDGWLPILLDEQRCATISRRAPVLSLLPARRVCSSLRAHLLRAGTGARSCWLARAGPSPSPGAPATSCSTTFPTPRGSSRRAPAR